MRVCMCVRFYSLGVGALRLLIEYRYFQSVIRYRATRYPRPSSFESIDILFVTIFRGENISKKLNEILSMHIIDVYFYRKIIYTAKLFKIIVKFSRSIVLSYYLLLLFIQDYSSHRDAFYSISPAIYISRSRNIESEASRQN